MFRLLLLLYLKIGIAAAIACVNNGPLGMITGSIQDWQITASSTYPHAWDKKCHEKYARVYLPNKYGWCAKNKSSSEWLQVNLGVAARVTGIMTQGRGDGIEWVTNFKVSYSMDAFYWQYIIDQYGNQRIFEGNVDSYAVRHSYLGRPLIARFIKVHTVHWHKHPSMRVEILGCQLCKEPIGLPPYGKMTASTYASFKNGKSCRPEDGNILSSKGWCSKKSDDSQWVQIDVGPPTLVTGVITKGRADTRRKNWVTRYKVSYSNDTRVWYFYKDANHLDRRKNWVTRYKVAYSNDTRVWYFYKDLYQQHPKQFGGNIDKNIERIHYLNSPFVARFIRVHPMDWHQKISMRVGLLGCPYTGPCGEGFMRVNEDTPCVENLAFMKKAWINSERHYQRHMRNRMQHEHASKAVDGNMDRSLSSCTVLDNLHGDRPTWMVDLGRQTEVSGVVIYTIKGSGVNQDTVKNLEKLVVYVDDKLKDNETELSGSMCNYVTRLNDAIFQEQIHLQCNRSLKGRYLRIEAWGMQQWSGIFSAVLCEVMVYA